MNSNLFSLSTEFRSGCVSRLIVFTVVVLLSGPRRIGFLPSLCTHVLFLPGSPAQVPQGHGENFASLVPKHMELRRHCTHRVLQHAGVEKLYGILRSSERIKKPNMIITREVDGGIISC